MRATTLWTWPIGKDAKFVTVADLVRKRKQLILVGFLGSLCWKKNGGSLLFVFLLGMVVECELTPISRSSQTAHLVPKSGVDVTFSQDERNKLLATWNSLGLHEEVELEEEKPIQRFF